MSDDYDTPMPITISVHRPQVRRVSALPTGRVVLALGRLDDDADWSTVELIMTDVAAAQQLVLDLINKTTAIAPGFRDSLLTTLREPACEPTCVDCDELVYWNTDQETWFHRRNVTARPYCPWTDNDIPPEYVRNSEAGR